jgi:Anti-sigma-K factor rskA/Putative zinc-finger
MMNAQHISQEDLALYALRTMSTDESAAVREHLSGCEVCRAELAMLEGDLAMVALSADQQPLPAGARERFMQRLAGEDQIRRPAMQAPEPIAIRRAPKNSNMASIGWAAAAAVFIMAAALGYEVSTLRSRLRESDNKIAALEASQSRASQMAEVLTAPTAQRVLLTAPKTPAAPTGRVAYLPSRGELIFQGNNLVRIPAGKTYELWVIPADGSAPIPAGLFQPDVAGNGSVVLPPIPLGVKAKAFGVTLEDAAGSKAPTAPILLAGAVADSGE